jgi:plasmid stability protein
MALMTSVQIKDVPEDVHTVLRQRAAAAHQSLQEHLLSAWLTKRAGPRSTRCWITSAPAEEARRRSGTSLRSSGRNVIIVDASVLVTADHRLAGAPGARCTFAVVGPPA